MALEVTRIEDGYAMTIGCADGALIELQAVDEETPRKTWELMIAKGTQGTIDTLKVDDLRKLGEGIVALADAVERSGL